MENCRAGINGWFIIRVQDGRPLFDKLGTRNAALSYRLLERGYNRNIEEYDVPTG